MLEPAIAAASIPPRLYVDVDNSLDSLHMKLIANDLLLITGLNLLFNLLYRQRAIKGMAMVEGEHSERKNNIN